MLRSIWKKNVTIRLRLFHTNELEGFIDDIKWGSHYFSPRNKFTDKRSWWLLLRNASVYINCRLVKGSKRKQGNFEETILHSIDHCYCDRLLHFQYFLPPTERSSLRFRANIFHKSEDLIAKIELMASRLTSFSLQTFKNI